MDESRRIEASEFSEMLEDELELGLQRRFPEAG
jgi:hypothetical protein